MSQEQVPSLTKLFPQGSYLWQKQSLQQIKESLAKSPILKP